MDTMFYAPDGGRFGDFALTTRGDELACIFIQNERSSTAQHQGVSVGNRLALATSDDGLNWRYRGVVMRPDEPWKNRSLWAPSLLAVDDRWAMLYSAVAQGDGPLDTQQSGLAWSDDLVSWQDVPANPVIPSTLASPHYRQSTAPRPCWRDPNAFAVGGTWYCTLAARDARAPVEVAGCVALLQSDDLISWQALPPLFSPRRTFELETPTVYRFGSDWYLLFGRYGSGHCMAWARADDPLGPYHEPPVNTLTPSWCYAGRVVERDGRLDFHHWIRDPVVGRPRTVLAPPKVLVAGDTLTLRLHPTVAARCAEVSMADLVAAAPSPGEPLQATSGWPNAPWRLDVAAEHYARTVTLERSVHGVTVHDLAPGDGVFDIRTVGGTGGAGDEVRIVLDGGFVELYVDGWFVHAFCLPPSSATCEVRVNGRKGS